VNVAVHDGLAGDRAGIDTHVEAHVVVSSGSLRICEQQVALAVRPGSAEPGRFVPLRMISRCPAVTGAVADHVGQLRPRTIGAPPKACRTGNRPRTSCRW
jgi:hypothetical protein